MVAAGRSESERESERGGGVLTEFHGILKELDLRDDAVRVGCGGGQGEGCRSCEGGSIRRRRQCNGRRLVGGDHGDCDFWRHGGCAEIVDGPRRERIRSRRERRSAELIRRREVLAEFGGALVELDLANGAIGVAGG